jgi:hypothetical protein
MFRAERPVVGRWVFAHPTGRRFDPLRWRRWCCLLHRTWGVAVVVVGRDSTKEGHGKRAVYRTMRERDSAKIANPRGAAREC